MKRSERHHLKENALAVWMTRVTEFSARRQREIGVVAVSILVVLLGVGAYAVWERQQGARGIEMLADALVTAQAPINPPPPPPDPDDPESAPPAQAFQPGSFTSEQTRGEAALQKFLATAAAYPETEAGITARYHAAATLTALGRSEEAEAQYEQVRALAGDGIYGRMATLGLANATAQAGRHDEAIALYEEVLADEQSTLPLDAILMQLGRVHLQADRATDAQAAFDRLVGEFPNSFYAPDAEAELERLRPGGPETPSPSPTEP